MPPKTAKPATPSEDLDQEITGYVTSDMKEWVKTYAKDHKVSVASVVRIALERMREARR